MTAFERVNIGPTGEELVKSEQQFLHSLRPKLSRFRAKMSTSQERFPPFLISAERLDSSAWKTYDPFLFCAYHDDEYPHGASEGDDPSGLGPDPRALAGRALGHDFSKLNGFSMYHGRMVPGFPAHRHFGFETVTLVRKGFVDHFDSLGGMARYGNNDVQWLSAGKGVLHSEMFPLLNADGPNPLMLLQIWLNLPAAKKNTPPTFHIGWAEDQAVKTFGSPPSVAEFRLIAGSMFGLAGMPPPPNSYATDPKSEIVIGIIRMQPGATLVLPPTSSDAVHRAIYMYAGSSLSLNTPDVDPPQAYVINRPMTMVKLVSNAPVVLRCQYGEAIAEMLILQGMPLNEPVFQSGPYVAGSRAELMEVMLGPHHDVWPFRRLDPVHHRSEGRFFQLGKDEEKQRPPYQAA